MQHLRAATQDILKRIETLSGKSVQLMRDDSLSVLATLQMARHGAAFHVLRYKPTDEPLDYLVAYQAGTSLTLSWTVGMALAGIGYFCTPNWHGWSD